MEVSLLETIKTAADLLDVFIGLALLKIWTCQIRIDTKVNNHEKVLDFLTSNK